MRTPAAPVVLINKFTVAPEEADQLVEAWAVDAAFMKSQPGFISTQLHRGIGESSVFLNYAIWGSTEERGRIMRTRAALGGHPVHAMLVHFPLAFLVGAFGFDLFWRDHHFIRAPAGRRCRPNHSNILSQ
jgi:hypothetical protein